MFELSQQDIYDLNSLSSEALQYTLLQDYKSSEAIEMQGYLRGMRDALFSLGVCSQTKVYDDLIVATYHITNKPLGSVLIL